MTCTIKRNLSPSEIARMAHLLREGASVTAIAEAMHRSRDTVRAWAKRAGIDLAPSSRAWTPDEETILLAALAQRLRPAAIGKTLNRSGVAVTARINFLGGAAYLMQRAPPIVPVPSLAPPPALTAIGQRDPWPAWKRAMDRLSAQSGAPGTLP